METLLSNLGELPAEAPLNAETSMSDRVIERRGHADDLAVLGMNREITAHATVRTNRIRASLLGFVPGAGLPHVVFALEHQCPGGAHADAVPAIDTRRIR